jgi:hypothetical protein
MMRPTASSSSKTLDKPDSPPRQRTAAKPAAKPKAPEGLATKAKKKVDEVAAKAKDVVTNGDHEEKLEEKYEGGETGTTSEPAAEKSTEVESSTVDTDDTVAGAANSTSDVPAAEEAEQAEHSAVESEIPKVQEEAVF